MAGRINIPPRHSSEVVPSLHAPGARFAQIARTDREALKEYAGTRQILPVEQVLHESTNIQPRAGNAVPGKLRVDQLVTRQQIGRATSELQSLMRSSYAAFCLKQKHRSNTHTTTTP